ncbi:hypothetical protein NHH03_19835 [Stieleria sp. TO1_6]|uniref:hypothetical protein n=1 Tax=Stieleria tagensis TaxID=2956795 RepID=UPI00209A7FE5|nr:hypothetical protein [Stieleria tagensis]MCO8124005.1 hypothetical protein [Stieleria tagensis]
MFKWLKKIVSGSTPPAPPTGSTVVSKAALQQTLQMATVWEVVDRFLVNNPSPTPYGVHALVDAGAANLMESSELFQVCEKIQEHGYQYPLNPTLRNELDPSELLEFLRWHGQNRIEKEYYANESTLRELIQQFRLSHR